LNGVGGEVFTFTETAEKMAEYGIKNPGTI
jgi:hypothetical protein